MVSCPTVMAHAVGSISERIVHLTAARKRVLQVLTDPENTGAGPEEVCRLAKVGRATYWKLRRDPAFLAVLEEIRQQLYPRWKHDLARRMFADAMVPLCEAKDAHALVRTREQAAAFLGLPVEAPKVQITASRSEHRSLRQFEGFPDEVLLAWAETGVWDREKWGPPPWEPRRRL